MTLIEAVNYIQISDGCDQITAVNQLRMALGDGEIRARWVADTSPLMTDSHVFVIIKTSGLNEINIFLGVIDPFFRIFNFS